MVEANNRPVQWQEGEYTVTRSTAWGGPGCHAGCGVLLYSKDGKIEKVEGDRLHPFNQGRLCPRCAALPDTVNNEYRLLNPMKRAKENRGKDAWEEISWDEAFDIVEAELRKVIDTDGPASIQIFNGTGRDASWHEFELAAALGTPNLTIMLSGIACYVPRLVGGLAQFGGMYPVADCSQQFEDRYDNPEWRAPEVLTIWGNNPLISNPDWFFGAWIVECMKRGSKLIVVDPKLTWLASHADVWLNLRPGTDGAMALGMLNVIIQEDLYDHDFVDRWTYGFDELAKQAAEYPLDKVAEITWVEAEVILEAARLFGSARPAAYQLGLAVDQQVSGFSAAQVIMAMHAITGSIEVPGGNFLPFGAPMGVSAGGTAVSDNMTEEVLAKGIGFDKYPIMKTVLAMTSPDETVKQLETGEPYPLKAAILIKSNGLACAAQDPFRWYKACRNLDFIVAMDLFMTPTIQLIADLVLPGSTLAEKDSVRAQFYNVSLTNRAIEPMGNCKTDAEIIMEIGSRFSKSVFASVDERAYYNRMLEPCGMTFEQLDAKGWAYPHYEYRRHEKGLLRPDGQPGFNTPTGRIEFHSLMLENFGLSPIPTYEEPVVSPVSTPEIYEEYPVILITGARSKASFHSEHRNVAKLREIVPDPFVEINPTYAAEHGINDGDWVWIESPKDRVRQRAKVTNAIQPGMALSYHAWWFPELGPEHDFGMWEVNNNRLLDMGNNGPSGFSSDVKNVLVKIYKAEKSPFEDPDTEIIEKLKGEN